MRTEGNPGAIRSNRLAPPFSRQEKAMKSNELYFEAPAGRTRNDAFASGSVLGAMLLSALAGAFVIDVDPSLANAAEAPIHYAAVEEAP